MYLQLQGEIPYSPDKVWKEIHKLYGILHFIQFGEDLALVIL